MACRADYAAAAIAVLTKAGHENKVYELAVDVSFTLTDLAAVVSSTACKFIEYRNLPAEAYKSALQSFGIPEGLVGILVDSDLGALIGRPTTTMSAAVAAAIS